eukprot:1191202-Prorocentrum_minimum.AAC.8
MAEMYFAADTSTGGADSPARGCFQAWGGWIYLEERLQHRWVEALGGGEEGPHPQDLRPQLQNLLRTRLPPQPVSPGSDATRIRMLLLKRDDTNITHHSLRVARGGDALEMLEPAEVEKNGSPLQRIT